MLGNVIEGTEMSILVRLSLAACLLALGACNSGDKAGNAAAEASAARPSLAETEAFIRKSAAEWANVAVTGDPSPLKRIIADDYVGVSSWGEVRDKAKMLTAPPSKNFTASKVDYVNIRHLGDIAIAQGGETLTRRDGGPAVRLIWTDTWMYRNGQWQIIASQDSVRPPDKPAP